LAVLLMSTARNLDLYPILAILMSAYPETCVKMTKNSIQVSAN